MRQTFPLVTAALALVACEAVSTERPLTVMGPNVIEPRPPITSACWSQLLPPEVHPIPSDGAVAEVCRQAATTTEWRYPSAFAVDNWVRNVDHRDKIVGRWATCGAGGVIPVQHAGIEFGSNGRWQLLQNDAAGALAPLSPPVRGYYYALGSGQLDLNPEGPLDQGGNILHTTFAPGMNAVRFEIGISGSESAIYARTTPSPSNGRDNAPSITDGRCEMIGTWDIPANNRQPFAPPASISFDASGNFVAGDLGSNLCENAPMYGTYRLSPGLFQLTSNFNMGLCDWWYSAGYPATFDATCAHVTLMQYWDNCTGGRGYLNGTTTLTRRE
ncbi:MAG TPA: hypothetical protein VFH73_17620 [Polyangia bacterium]|jgi:hypothetical protein|nr:hypothetical protein [Polyangia bacterium]